MVMDLLAISSPMQVANSTMLTMHFQVIVTTITTSMSKLTSAWAAVTDSSIKVITSCSF